MRWLLGGLDNEAVPTILDTPVLEVDHGKYNISVIMAERMLLILDEFNWQRPVSRKKGLLWEERDGYLTLANLPNAVFKPYQPHPGIFRDFADLRPTPEAALNFANRYGRLQDRPGLDSFDFWRQGIQHMSQLVALSDAVTQADWKRIPKALEPFLSNSSLASAADIRPISQKQRRGEEVSRNELAHAAVMRLCQAIAPAERFNVEGFWSPSHKVALRFKHADLLGFMFYQLGLALIGGRQFRRCDGCGKWSLTYGVSRSNRITCSDYCRLRLCRQRKKTEELHQQGWSPHKIAREIREDVAKVKKWLLR